MDENEHLQQIGIADLHLSVRKAVAERALQERDARTFVDALRSDPLFSIAKLRDVLLRDEFYEQVLVCAYCGLKNLTKLTTMDLVSLFKAGDRKKLRELGQELPAGDTFELYRGVSGVEAERKTAGISWTCSRRRACWYAWRYRKSQAVDPAVHRAVFHADDIFLVTRRGDEFIAIPPTSPPRLNLTGEEIEREHDAYEGSNEFRSDLEDDGDGFRATEGRQISLPSLPVGRE